MKNQVSISTKDLLELIHWSRRYCDGRSTYAPHNFNDLYRRIRKENEELFQEKDQFDQTLTEQGKYFPYAQDGMYNDSTGSFDARK